MAKSGQAAQSVSQDDAVPRASEIKTVSDWLRSSGTFGQHKLSIFGISGYGGMGKTYLLDVVLNDLQLRHSRWLEIRVDGSNASSLGDFIRLFDDKFSPRKIYADRPGEDFFPQTRKLVQRHAALEKN